MTPSQPTPVAGSDGVPAPLQPRVEEWEPILNQLRRRGTSRWRLATCSSLLLHASSALAAVYWWDEIRPELQAMQRGVATVEMVASTDSVRQEVEQEITIEKPREPEPPEPLTPQVEVERQPPAPIDTPPPPPDADESTFVPPPPQIVQQRVEQILEPPKPPIPRQPPPMYEVTAEVALVDSTASPLSRAEEGIETPDELPIKQAINRPPPYPADALAASREGVVTLLVRVAPNGSVVQIRISQSSGTPSLDSAAMNAVRGWTFTPGRKNGLPILSEVNVPVRFTIRR